MKTPKQSYWTTTQAAQLCGLTPLVFRQRAKRLRLKSQPGKGQWAERMWSDTQVESVKVDRRTKGAKQ